MTKRKPKKQAYCLCGHFESCKHCNPYYKKTTNPKKRIQHNITINGVVAILAYSLPEYERDFKDAQNGWKWKSVVRELQEELRKVYKYGDNETAIKYANHWSDKLHELVKDHSLDLYE